MREIIFRGKMKSDNAECKKGDWVQGDFVRLKDGKNEIYCIYGKGEVFSKTVGQYTGLTDKNGKKIFEGDIGRYKQTDGAKCSSKPIICTGKVVYNPKTTSFAVDSIDELGAKNYDYFPIKNFEIIGNIHDNPKLLKEGAE